MEDGGKGIVVKKSGEMSAIVLFGGRGESNILQSVLRLESYKCSFTIRG